MAVSEAAFLLPEESLEFVRWLDSYEDKGPNTIYLLDGNKIPEDEWRGGGYVWASAYQFWHSEHVPIQLHGYPFLVFIRTGSGDLEGLRDAIICNIRNLEKAWVNGFEKSPWGTPREISEKTGYHDWITSATEVAKRAPDRKLRPELIPPRKHRSRSRIRKHRGYIDSETSLKGYDPIGEKSSVVSEAEKLLTKFNS